VTKRVLLILVCVVAIGALAAPKVLPLLQDPKERSAAKAGAAHAEGAPLQVSTFVVHAAPYAESVVSTGTLRAEEGVELQAEINGKIVAITFTEGTRVRAGDLLVKLNDADLVAQLARARFRKELAVLREQRMARLLQEGVARREEHDTALNELNVQTAEMDLIQAQLAKTEIRAPFDGVVGLRYVSVGAFVNANARIATLQRLERLKIDFSVPEKYAGRIRPGNAIRFTVAGGGKAFPGEVYAIDPRIDAATRTLVIRAVCPNDGARLFPGAFANVEIVLARDENALLVPSVAVVPGLQETNVFVLADGKAMRRAVRTGSRTETSVQIVSGLAAGDIVITSGLQQLRTGLPVLASAGETRL
jgi:membrane fusion protein (multidrug efflux system)